MLVLSLMLPRAEAAEVAIHGVAEQWSDPGISTVYKSGALMAGLGFGFDLANRIDLNLDVAYKRLPLRGSEGVAEGEEATAAPPPSHVLNLVPGAALVRYSFGEDGVSAALPWLAFGPTVVSFSEQHTPNDKGLGVTSGARIALELRGGIRIATGLIQPAPAPANQGVQGLDVDVFVARRSQRPGLKGFDLGAWRVGAAAVLRF